jgi:glycosyltransferase involved in cell wall biosynthesis
MAMKVLWFSNTPASGAEYLKCKGVRGGWLSSLDVALSRHVELHVAFEYPKFSEEFVYKWITYHPVCHRHYKLRFIKNILLGGFTDKEDLPKYLSLIEQIKPDLIHIHGTENPFGAIIDVCKIPVMVSIQGNNTVYFHKFLAGFERKYLFVKKFRFRKLTDFPFFKSHYAGYRLTRRSKYREMRNIRKCRHILGRTDWDRRISRILAPDSHYYHADEMLRKSFHETTWTRPETTKLIIHTTTGENLFKGFETICEALTLLLNRGMDVEWRVAGIEKDDLIIRLARKKLGKEFPAKGLVILGIIDEDILKERLLEALIYVMPSHIENSPNSLCEAMLIGIPCISTCAGGAGSLLKDGEEGIVIQDGDPWVMAGAILELHNDPDKAARFGLNARKKALVRHDPERIVHDLLNTYSLVKENKSGS